MNIKRNKLHFQSHFETFAGSKNVFILNMIGKKNICYATCFSISRIIKMSDKDIKRSKVYLFKMLYNILNRVPCFLFLFLVRIRRRERIQNLSCLKGCSLFLRHDLTCSGSMQIYYSINIIFPFVRTTATEKKTNTKKDL